MSQNHKLGLLAEYLVIIRYLVAGYLPIKHRWKNKIGEIDLIFRRGNSIIFCEVKARSSNFQDKYVSARQEERLFRSAEHFISLNQKLNIKNVRFDLAVVKSIFNIHIYKGWIGW